MMHNYEPSVNVLFYPTVMSYVQDDQQSFVGSSKTGLSGRVAALNPLSNRVISFKVMYDNDKNIVQIVQIID